MTRERMLTLVDQYDSLFIAGISECRTALALVTEGTLVIITGTITGQGGSGRVARSRDTQPDQEERS